MQSVSGVRQRECQCFATRARRRQQQLPTPSGMQAPGDLTDEVNEEEHVPMQRWSRLDFADNVEFGYLWRFLKKKNETIGAAYLSHAQTGRSMNKLVTSDRLKLYTAHDRVEFNTRNPKLPTTTGQPGQPSSDTTSDERYWSITVFVKQTAQ